jgi:hypothetical protein
MAYHPATGDGCVFANADELEQSGYVEAADLTVPPSGATTKHPLPVSGAPKKKAKGASKPEPDHAGTAAKLGLESKEEVTDLLTEMEIKFDGRKSADALAAEFYAEIEAYLEEDEEEDDEDAGEDEPEDEE